MDNPQHRASTGQLSTVGGYKRRSENQKDLQIMIGEKARKRFANNHLQMTKYKDICYRMMRYDDYKLELDQFQKQEVSAIAAALVDLTTFRSLALWGDAFNPVEEEEEALKKSPRKRGNSTDTRTTQALLETEMKLSLNVRQLLNLSRGLLRHFQLNHHLQVFTLHGLKMHKDIWQQIAKGIKAAKNLLQLNLSHLVLSHGALDILTPVISEHRGIECLDFSHNLMDSDSGRFISKIISTQSERRDQIVWACGLRGEVPEGQAHRSGLFKIVIENNGFNDNFLFHLIHALNYDEYIQIVSLKHNKISEEGVKECCKLLKSNRSLLSLDLRHNPGYTMPNQRKLALRLLKNIERAQQKNENFNPRDLIDPEILSVQIPKHMMQTLKHKIEPGQSKSQRTSTVSPRTQPKSQTYQTLNTVSTPGSKLAPNSAKRRTPSHPLRNSIPYKTQSMAELGQGSNRPPISILDAQNKENLRGLGKSRAGLNKRAATHRKHSGLKSVSEEGKHSSLARLESKQHSTVSRDKTSDFGMMNGGGGSSQQSSHSARPRQIPMEFSEVIPISGSGQNASNQNSAFDVNEIICSLSDQDQAARSEQSNKKRGPAHHKSARGAALIKSTSENNVSAKWHSQQINARRPSTANKCKNCRKVEKELYVAESKCSTLFLENQKLRRHIRLLMGNSGNPASWSNSAIQPNTTEEQQVYAQNQESISLTGHGINSTKYTPGTGQDCPEEAYQRIDYLMAELTRIMDSLDQTSAGGIISNTSATLQNLFFNSSIQNRAAGNNSQSPVPRPSLPGVSGNLSHIGPTYAQQVANAQMNQINHTSLAGVHNNTMNQSSGTFSLNALNDRSQSRMGPGKLNIPSSINEQEEQGQDRQ